MNGSFARLSGYEADGIAGLHPNMVLRPERDDAASGDLNAALGARGHWSGRATLRCSGGDAVAVLVDNACVGSGRGAQALRLFLVRPA